MTDPAQKSVLSNGLRVVTVELPHLHTGMIAAYVRAGSRHEDPALNGVSHFLEHLFFRGSEGYPEGRAMNALVEDCGGSLNGVTTRDHGYYFSPAAQPMMALACRGKDQAAGEGGGLITRDCAEPDPLDPTKTQCGFLRRRLRQLCADVCVRTLLAARVL